MKYNRHLSMFVLAAVVGLSACAGERPELRVFALSYQSLDPELMEAIFAEQSDIRMRTAGPGLSGPALQALVNDQADLALIENSNPFISGVRAVLPAYKSVLHLLARKGFDMEPGTGSLAQAKIYIPNDSFAGRAFVYLAAARQGVAREELDFQTEIDEHTNLIVYFGPITPLDPVWYQSGFRLISLGEYTQTSADHLGGIGYLLPQMERRVIPPRTYDLPGNEVPIVTLQVDMLLVARKEIPEAVIYELTRTLIEQKQRFTAIAPALFSGITEAFDPLDLNFPLHAGARRFLHRDEPSLLERYAETINMLVYVTALLLTSLVAAARWRSRRKKDRADVFYESVLAIRARAGAEDSAPLLQELQSLEQEAFKLLIAEKLAADESFRIFTDLLERTRAELRAGS